MASKLSLSLVGLKRGQTARWFNAGTSEPSQVPPAGHSGLSRSVAQLLLGVALLLAPTSGLAAQGPDQQRTLVRIRSEHRVRGTLAVEGSLRMIQNDTLWIDLLTALDGSVATLDLVASENEAMEIFQGHGKSRHNGVVASLLTGGSFGVAVIAKGIKMKEAVLPLAVFTAVGYGLGALPETDRWKKVPTRGQTIESLTRDSRATFQNPLVGVEYRRDGRSSRVEGNLLSLGSDSLLLGAWGNRDALARIAWSEVEELRAKRGRTRHTAKGAVTGVLFGALVGLGAASIHGANHLEATLMTAWPFGVLGGIIGRLIETDRWIHVPFRDSHIEPGPRRDIDPEPSQSPPDSEKTTHTKG